MILIFLIAISLSMDAFSLSLAYGTNNLSKKEINNLSMVVGLYHFFMPILGMLIGNYILNILKVNEKVIVLIIFCVIGINMIVESFKDNNVKKMKIIEMFIFGFAVSIDSFSIGIGIHNITNNVLISSFVFSVTSLLFTYIGLVFGKKLNNYYGKYSTIFGGIMLIILGIYYVF